MGLAPKSSRAGLAAVIVVAAAARFAVVAWAGGRFAPIGDGVYYHTFAVRLAEGLGYTWRWPDGVVTYAAHYPVGYPALLSLAYRLAGASFAAAGALAALLGVAAAAAMYRAALAASGSARAALGAGLAVALDPALVFYTPALMTEGVAASLLAIAAWAALGARGAAAGRGEAVPRNDEAVSRHGEATPRGGGTAAQHRVEIAAEGRAGAVSRDGSAVSRKGETSARPWRAPLFAALAGLALGAATLVRPQCLLFAPFFGALVAPPGASRRARARDAAIATAVAFCTCLPWTLRNCVRMKRCALVSFNGGWNLLIGATPSAKGTWAPLEVPGACRLVFDEALKDECFGRVARERIAAEPLTWLGLLPEKWSSTFDFPSAAPWYLHDANPGAFSDRAAAALKAAELASSRLALVACLLAVALGRGPRRGARALVALGGVALAASAGHPYFGYLALVASAALFGRALAGERALVALAAVVVGGTALVHGAFFGAGRYALVVAPFVMALAGASAARAAPRLAALAAPRARARRAPSPP